MNEMCIVTFDIPYFPSSVSPWKWNEVSGNKKNLHDFSYSKSFGNFWSVFLGYYEIENKPLTYFSIV